MPPRARPVRFEMDLTRREVESERRARVGDKVVARVAGVCQEGCYPNKDNHVNQDAMLTLGREELGSEGELLLGVFDGHGKYGEDCASIAREAFAETLARETARENGLSPGYARTFETVNDVVCKTLGENAGFSGCTAITAMFCADGKIKVGNVGDSRCVVAAELDAMHTVLDQVSSARRFAESRVELLRSRRWFSTTGSGFAGSEPRPDVYAAFLVAPRRAASGSSMFAA